MLRAILFALALGAAVAPLHAKSLYWEALEVDARLDSEGRLHVVERQHYVFDGDWNGGERRFDIRFGQKLDLVRVTRVTPEGSRVDLREGSLDEVDHYGWGDNRALRWRSRRPSDPPFQNSELVYEIEYILSNILRTRSEGGETIYILDHDFAFADRDGEIRQFTLELELDPVWSPRGDVQSRYSAGPLPPGTSFPLDVELRYSGSGAPAGVARSAPLGLKLATVFASMIAVGLIFNSFLAGERARGRFSRVEIGSIDEEWLRKNVFFAPPEVIGALWDTSTDASEVAAMLARLAQEKKIETSVVKKGFFSTPQLEMKLLVPRSAFTPVERQLIDAFFIDGDSTDTTKIRDHYRKSGFNPASLIREELEKSVKGDESWAEEKLARNWPRDIVLLVAAFILLGVSALLAPGNPVVAIPIGASGIFAVIFGSILAVVSRNSIRRLGTWSFFFSLLTILQIGFLLVIAGTALPISLFAFIAASFAVVAFYWFVIGFAPFRESLQRLAVRKRLLAARDYFEAELRKPQPALRDEWFPYVIAFGLGANVDRWFSSYGGESRATTSTFSGGSSSSSYSSRGHGGPGGSWSGGGTSFGGAGATGAWAAAAGGIASGVAAPSSSGGGGGGGGSSSSGGGGGGGW